MPEFKIFFLLVPSFLLPEMDANILSDLFLAVFPLKI